MKRREWPFKGDSPVVRARKSALAYRQTAQDLNGVIATLCDAIREIDPRIVGWMDNEGFASLYKQIQEGTFGPADPIAALDQRLYEWGEDWHAEIRREAYDPDDWITGEEAGKVLGVTAATVNRNRNRGRITGKWIKEEGDPNGKWFYRAGDVYSLSSDVRPRVSRGDGQTVTVPTDGTGDSK